MTIIEYIKKKLKFPSGRIYTLSVICIISQSLLVMNETMAGTTVENKTDEHSTQTVEKKESWYEGTWLDGSWIPQSVQIHGFLSQGFIHTSANNFFGETANNVSTDYREIGLNGSWRVIPELQLSMQIVWRNAGATDTGGVRIDYGFANYSFFSTETTLIGVKGGRVPTPLGFYNETRDVLSTRPSILLPQSIYFDKNRNIALSADGGYFYGEHNTDYGDIFFDIGGVVPRFDDAEGQFSTIGNFASSFNGEASWVTRLAYEWQSGQVRLQVTYGDFTVKGTPEPGASTFQPGKIRFNPLVFSAQYNAENWSITSEYALRRTRITEFGLFPNVDDLGQSYYIQGSYQFTSWLEAMVRYDSFIADLDDKNGEQFSAFTGLPAYSRFAQDWTVGLRFTILPKLLLSAEYHNVNGTGWLPNIENQNPAETSQYWNMYLLMISYDF